MVSASLSCFLWGVLEVLLGHNSIMNTGIDTIKLITSTHVAQPMIPFACYIYLLSWLLS